MDVHDTTVRVYGIDIERPKKTTVDKTDSLDKIVQCEFCGKTFTKAVRLKVHRRMHTDERPFKCNICSSSFRVRTVLQAHMRIHRFYNNHNYQFYKKMIPNANIHIFQQ